MSTKFQFKKYISNPYTKSKLNLRCFMTNLLDAADGNEVVAIAQRKGDS